MDKTKFTANPELDSEGFSQSASLPALSKGYIHNFEQLKLAVRNGDLALISARIAATNEAVALLAATVYEEDGSVRVIPFGHLCPGNPFEFYADPTEGGAHD